MVLLVVVLLLVVVEAVAVVVVAAVEVVVACVSDELPHADTAIKSAPAMHTVDLRLIASPPSVDDEPASLEHNVEDVDDGARGQRSVDVRKGFVAAVEILDSDRALQPGRIDLEY